MSVLKVVGMLIAVLMYLAAIVVTISLTTNMDAVAVVALIGGFIVGGALVGIGVVE